MAMESPRVEILRTATLLSKLQMAGRFAGPPSQRQCVVNFAHDYKTLQELLQFRRTLLQNRCILRVLY
jgi:hypothetical protein